MATAKKTAVAKSAGTGVTTFNQQAELEKLRERLAAPSGDKIKISNKQFKLPSGDILDFLDIVIVDFVYFNAYYESQFDPNNIVPPNCFGINVEPKGMVPSSNSPDKQCDVCTGCWANEFGSNGKGKACQNRVLMAVLPSDANEDTPFSILDISPTAVKGFSTYIGSVARSLQRMPYGVITHVECNPATKHDVAMFSDPQLIDDEDFLTMVMTRQSEARERLLTEPDVSGFQPTNEKSSRGSGSNKLKAPAKRRA